MREYDVFIHVDLLARVPKTGVQRTRIMQFLETLRNDPRTPGDFTEQDATLRQREIKIVGDYAVTYWVDDPVRAIMVVDIQRADG